MKRAMHFNEWKTYTPCRPELVTEQLRRALDPLKVYNLPTIEALLIFPFYTFFFSALAD